MREHRAIVHVRQRTRDLLDKAVVRMRRRSEEVHASRREVDHERRVVGDETAGGPDLGGEEVGRRNRAPMCGQKRAPRRRAFRDRADALRAQDGRNGRSGDAMPKILQGPLDPPVAPRRILPGHPRRDVMDLAPDTGPSPASSFGRPFLRDEPPVPPKNRIRCHQRGNLPQRRSPQRVAPARQSASLRIRQAQASSAELRLQDAVFFTHRSR